MSADILLKSEKLLDLVGSVRDDDGEAFAFVSPDGKAGMQLMLQRVDWEEMGKPSKLTITIVPGDLLNEED